MPLDMCFMAFACLWIKPIEPKDNDLHLIRVSLEYFMKQVDDNCYKRKKTLGETMWNDERAWPLSLLPSPITVILRAFATPYVFRSFFFRRQKKASSWVREKVCACGSTGSMEMRGSANAWPEMWGSSGSLPVLRFQGCAMPLNCRQAAV